MIMHSCSNQLVTHHFISDGNSVVVDHYRGFVVLASNLLSWIYITPLLSYQLTQLTKQQRLCKWASNLQYTVCFSINWQQISLNSFSSDSSETAGCLRSRHAVPLRNLFWVRRISYPLFPNRDLNEGWMKLNPILWPLSHQGLLSRFY